MTEKAKTLASNTSPSNAGCEGSIPVWGAKIPHASQPKKQKTNIVMNSIKTKKGGLNLTNLINSKPKLVII